MTALQAVVTRAGEAVNGKHCPLPRPLHHYQSRQMYVAGILDAFLQLYKRGCQSLHRCQLNATSHSADALATTAGIPSAGETSKKYCHMLPSPRTYHTLIRRVRFMK